MEFIKNDSKAFFLVVIMVGMLMSACNLSSSSSDSAAQTVTAAFRFLTETANAAPTNTAIPVVPTQPPVVVVQPTVPPPPPAETVPPQPAVAMLVAIEDTNCRMGADPIYPRTGSFLKNMQARIIGTNQNQSWWLIEDPRGEGQSCWVWGQTTQASGDLSTVPYIPSPQLPDDIPLPYPTP